jgi:hypothetical protein
LGHLSYLTTNYIPSIHLPGASPINGKPERCLPRVSEIILGPTLGLSVILLPYFQILDIFYLVEKHLILEASLARHWWFTPVILTAQEAEIRRITVQSQPGQIVWETLSRKKKNITKKGWWWGSSGRASVSSNPNAGWVEGMTLRNLGTLGFQSYWADPDQYWAGHTWW